mmetsp:Transcript_4272/g.8387  ORF Transcript_4272/g.8387 Transcript_4272/m.8387 type:complete len:181 (-) Transcript_4272:732-1274(-)
MRVVVVVADTAGSPTLDAVELNVCACDVPENASPSFEYATSFASTSPSSLRASLRSASHAVAMLPSTCLGEIRSPLWIVSSSLNPFPTQTRPPSSPYSPHAPCPMPQYSLLNFHVLFGVHAPHPNRTPLLREPETPPTRDPKDGTQAMQPDAVPLSLSHASSPLDVPLFPFLLPFPPFSF